MTSPAYYAFPGDVEVLDISQHLTGNAAQIVQYVCRSSRLDGNTKGEDVADLHKARDFLDREILRRELLDQEATAEAAARILDQPMRRL